MICSHSWNCYLFVCSHDWKCSLVMSLSLAWREAKAKPRGHLRVRANQCMLSSPFVQISACFLLHSCKPVHAFFSIRANQCMLSSPFVQISACFLLHSCKPVHAFFSMAATLRVQSGRLLLSLLIASVRRYSLLSTRLTALMSQEIWIISKCGA